MSTDIIKLNRGDSYEFSIFIPDKVNKYKNYLLTAKDAVYFALMYPNQRFEDAIILKGYTLEDQDPINGKITVKIAPNDTRTLTPGIYYYTVKLQRGGTLGVINDYDTPDEIRTIIERTKFILNE